MVSLECTGARLSGSPLDGRASTSAEGALRASGLLLGLRGSPVGSWSACIRLRRCGLSGANRRSACLSRSVRWALALGLALGLSLSLLLLLLLVGCGSRRNRGLRPAWRDVQALVNLLGDGLDLGAEFLLNLIKIEPVFVGDQVDGEAEMSETAGASDAVEVGLRVLGEVKVDDDIDGLDVDAAGEEVGADEVAADAVSEVVEDAVTVGLEHLSVRVET